MRLKDELQKEHAGFAVTFEVMITLVSLCVMLNFTLYILRVMDVQRYMNTVMTSTASQASRWGGVNTKPYASNVSSTTLLATAQSQLDYVAVGFNAKITGSPDKITNIGDSITIIINYTLPSVFSTMSDVNVSNGSYDMYTQTKTMQMYIDVRSVMEPGRLL